MNVELINEPHSVKKVKQLMEDNNVYFMVNTYSILYQLYVRAGKDTSKIDPRDCWKLKSLKKMYERSNDPEAFLMRMTHENFIKIV